MSRFLEAYRVANPDDPRTDEALILAWVPYLTANGRQDVLVANPDLQSEYDSLQRAMRPSLGQEVGTALKTGLVDTLPRDLEGFLAAGSETLGRIAGVKGGGEFWLDKAKQQNVEAAQKWEEIGGRSVPSVSDIGKTATGPLEYLGDITRYALPTLAEATPGLAAGLLSGGVGGALLKAAPLAGAAAGVGALSTGQGIGGQYAQLGKVSGPDYGLGNIDLNSRPVVANPEAGGTSTVYSMSFNEDGKEVLIPRVAADGSGILSEKDAIAQYHRTGQFLGKFNTVAEADAYAQKVHEDQASMQGDYNGRALTAAAVGGTLSGLINTAAMMLPISRLFPGASPTVAQRMAANVLERAGVNDGVLAKAAALATRAAVSGGQGAAVFSPASVIQQAFSIASQEYATGVPLPAGEVKKQIIEAASSGALVGGAMNLGMEPFARHAAPAVTPPPAKTGPDVSVDAAKLARDASAGPQTPGQKAVQKAVDAVDSAERSIFGPLDTDLGLKTAVMPEGPNLADFQQQTAWAQSAPERMGVGPAERTASADFLRTGGPVVPAAETAFADQLRSASQPEDLYAVTQRNKPVSGGPELSRIPTREGVPENPAPARVGGGQLGDESGGIVAGRTSPEAAPQGQAGKVEAVTPLEKETGLTKGMQVEVTYFDSMTMKNRQGSGRVRLVRENKVTGERLVDIEINDPGSIRKRIIVPIEDVVLPVQESRPLPPETLVTVMPNGDRPVIQIDVPGLTANDRPIFSGSPDDAAKAGYKVDLPADIPVGQFRVSELTQPAIPDSLAAQVQAKAEPPSVMTLAPDLSKPAIQGVTYFGPGDGTNQTRLQVATDGLQGRGDRVNSAKRAILLRDNLNGKTYALGLGVHGSEIRIQEATARAAGKQNARVVDLEHGTSAASAKQVMAERLPGGEIPRYDVVGYADFKEPQGKVAFSFASEQAMRDHPDMLRGEQARLSAPLPKGRSRMRGARVKTVSVSEPAAETRIDPAKVADELADRTTPATALEAKEGPSVTPVEQFRYEIQRQLREGATDKAVKDWMAKNLPPDERVTPKYVGQLFDVIKADLTLRAPESWRVPSTEAEALFNQTLANLKADGADIALFPQEAAKELTGMAGQIGFQLSDAEGRSLIGLSVNSMRGGLTEGDLVRLVHEVTHHVTKKMSPEIQAAFHSAVDRLPWTGKRFLMNPRSLDLRLLANADPATLSDAQKAALSRVTPAELQRLRQTPAETLKIEGAVEHAAQLAIDRPLAQTTIQRIVATVKAVLYRVAMAMQKAFKGPDAISPRLADAYVANRLTAFLSRDPNALSNFTQSFRKFIGAPATQTERYTNHLSLDGEVGPNYHYDTASGLLIPNDVATHTPQGVIDQINKAIMVARNNAEARKLGLDFTLVAPGESLGSETAAATRFAVMNHEEDTMRRIFALPEIRRILPGGMSPEKAQAEYLGIATDHQAAARRNAAFAEFRRQVDPLTERPINLRTNSRIIDLPFSEDGSSSRDLAVREGLSNFLHYKANLQDKLSAALEEIDRLSKRQKGKTISEGEIAELDELKRRVPILGKILSEPGGLNDEIDRLGSKIGLAYDRPVTPDSTIQIPPHENATEAEIMKAENAITIPKSMIFSVEQAKTTRSAIGRLDAWLANSANVEKGAIYGTLKAVSRQLHVIDTNDAYAANAGRFRKTALGAISAIMRNTGLPSLRWLGERIYELQGHIDPNTADSTIYGDRWSHSLRQWKEAMGARKMTFEEFRRLYRNPVEYLMEKIPDGTPNRVERLMAAMAKIKGREIPAKAQPAFRDFVNRTLESGKLRAKWFNEFALKVKDPDLANMLRGLVRQGFHTGQRWMLTNDMGAIHQAMAPTWIETGDSVLGNAAKLYRDNRPALVEQLKRYFPQSVVEKFVRPLVEGTQLRFDEPKRADQAIRAKARLSSVRMALRQSGGDIVVFSDALYRLEGGRPGGEGEYLQDNLKTLKYYFDNIGRILKDNDQAKAGMIEVHVREMMDARLGDDLPDEWLHYQDYDASSNHRLLMRLSINSALGRDGAASTEFQAAMADATKTLIDLQRTETDYRMLEHKTPDEIKKLMGEDAYKLALQAPDHLDIIQKLPHIMAQATKTTGELLGDMRPMVELMQFNSNLLLQNPRSLFFQVMDVFAPFYQLGLSGTAFKEAARGANVTLASMTHSLAQSFGRHIGWEADFLQRKIDSGYKDANNYISLRDQWADYGAGALLDRPSRPEPWLTRFWRVNRRLIKRGKALTNLSVNDIRGMEADWPLVRERENLGPKFRLLGIFTTGTNAINDGAFAARYKSIFDVVARGVEAVNRSGDPQRMANALRSGDAFLDGKTLGYKKGWVLDDSKAFDYLRDAVASKLGQGSLEQMVADAWTRTKANPNDPLITDAQFKRIGSLAAAEINMNGGFTSTPAPFYNEHLMLFSPFMRWPINEMFRTGNAFRDPQGRATLMTAIGGLKALMLGIVPLTLAASYATDLYDEKVYGKKSNIRNLHPADIVDDPGAFTAAAIERLARFGIGGLAGEAASRVVNIDSPRGTTSIGDRILIFSQMDNFAATMAGLLGAKGNFSYASFVRPMLQMSGLGSALQYQQILNTQLGLTNQEAEVNNRISVGNYLRSSGRDLGLNVRVGSQGSLPTPITPWIGQMEMAALSNDSVLFNQAFQRAVAAVRKFKPDEEDPVKYVADAFRARHPLRRVFATTPTEQEYQQVLGDLNDQGRQTVMKAIGSFNRYQLQLAPNSEPFYGKKLAAPKSSFDLLARVRNSTGNVFGGSIFD